MYILALARNITLVSVLTLAGGHVFAALNQEASKVTCGLESFPHGRHEGSVKEKEISSTFTGLSADTIESGGDVYSYRVSIEKRNLGFDIELFLERQPRFDEGYRSRSILRQNSLIAGQQIIVQAGYYEIELICNFK